MTNLLLDSSTFLWFIWADSRLTQTARRLIENPSNRKSLSVASCWEIAIKSGLGKLRLGAPARDFFLRELAINRFELLEVSLEHVAGVETLPLHHRDPFDRLLASQSLLEQLSLISSDAIFDQYGVARNW